MTLLATSPKIHKFRCILIHGKHTVFMMFGIWGSVVSTEREPMTSQSTYISKNIVFRWFEPIKLHAVHDSAWRSQTSDGLTAHKCSESVLENDVCALDFSPCGESNHHSLRSPGGIMKLYRFKPSKTI